MKDFIKHYKISIAILVYILIVSLAVLFFAWPMIKKASEENEKMQEKIAWQENQKSRISELPSIREQFDMIKAKENNMDILLSKNNVVTLIEKLEKMSDETGNEIKIEMNSDQNDKKTVTQTKKKDDNKEKSILDNIPNDKYIRMKISLRGNWKNFVGFLKKLENMEYYSDEVSFNITSSKKGNNSSKSNPFEVSNNGADLSEDKNDVISSTIDVIFYLGE